MSSNVYACMRASVSLRLLETEAGIPAAKKKAHKMMGKLKYSAKILKNMDAGIQRVRKEKQQREAEQEKETAEKSKEME